MAGKAIAAAGQTGIGTSVEVSSLIAGQAETRRLRGTSGATSQTGNATAGHRNEAIDALKADSGGRAGGAVGRTDLLALAVGEEISVGAGTAEGHIAGLASQAGEDAGTADIAR